jgi:hypothetical protein
MTAADLVITLFRRIDGADVAGARHLLAEDFAHTSRVHPEPLGPDAWLAAYAGLLAAFSDLDHGITGLRDRGDEADGVFNVRARHTGRLVIPAAGIDLPASGCRIALPPEPFTARARDGLVVSLDVRNPPGGGLMGQIDRLRAGCRD